MTENDKQAERPSLAHWLRDRRKRRGLTIRALATRAGVSHPRISQIEGGDTATPDMIRRLAAAVAPDDATDGEKQSIVMEGLGAAFGLDAGIPPGLEGFGPDFFGMLASLSPEDQQRMVITARAWANEAKEGADGPTQEEAPDREQPQPC